MRRIFKEILRITRSSREILCDELQEELVISILETTTEHGVVVGVIQKI